MLASPGEFQIGKELAADAQGKKGSKGQFD
jgi:hypothetical protein